MQLEEQNHAVTRGLEKDLIIPRSSGPASTAPGRVPARASRGRHRGRQLMRPVLSGNEMQPSAWEQLARAAVVALWRLSSALRSHQHPVQVGPGGLAECVIADLLSVPSGGAPTAGPWPVSGA